MIWKGQYRGLWGKLPTRGADSVDFRDQQGVYVLYDGNFRIVYVGQTGASEGENRNRLFDRLKSHKRNHLAYRWEMFSWYGLRWVLNNPRADDNRMVYLSQERIAASAKTPDVLKQMEAILITAAEPPHNRQGASFGDARLYLQMPKNEVV